MCISLLVHSTLDDYDFALEKLQDEQIELVNSSLKLSRDALTKDMKYLPSQLTGRITVEDLEGQDALKRLVDQAAKPDFDCFLSTQGMCHCYHH